LQTISCSKLRKKYQQWEKQHRHTGLSTLGQTAAMTAYATGDEWLRDLLAVVEKNYQLLRISYNFGSQFLMSSQAK
jgi:bifunctional pyridoxal-dependent enzyme with beta-cystathionase and maltose regulon repressor activities